MKGIGPDGEESSQEDVWRAGSRPGSDGYACPYVSSAYPMVPRGGGGSVSSPAIGIGNGIGIGSNRAEGNALPSAEMLPGR